MGCALMLSVYGEITNKQPRGLSEAEALDYTGPLGLKRAPSYLLTVFRTTSR